MGLLPYAAQRYRSCYLNLGAKPESALTTLDTSPTMKSVGCMSGRIVEREVGGDQCMCRTYGAPSEFGDFPAFPRWANLCRAYGAE